MGLLNLLFGNAEQSDKIKITLKTNKSKSIEYLDLPDYLKDQSELTEIKRDTYLTKLICAYMRDNINISKGTANYRRHSIKITGGKLK